MNVIAILLLLILISAEGCYSLQSEGDEEVVVDEAVRPRIIGGSDASIGEIPYQVSFGNFVRNKYQHQCGGSLIGPRTVLTAAHCCYYLSGAEAVIRYDGVEMSKLKKMNMVAKQLIHPRNTRNKDYDFCILTLRNIVQNSSTVSFVQIANKTPPPGTRVRVSGWGRIIGNDSKLPEILQKLDKTILSVTECEEKMNQINITSRMICSKHEHGNDCRADSGGPVVGPGGNFNGIVSWGLRDCPLRYPSVFSNPVTVRRWIISHIR